MPAKKLVETLKTKALEISTVESCTGGYLINQITNIEGASYITKGGLVLYSNEQKIKAGIPSEVIESYGVYSIECARAMSKLGLDFFNSNISVGITGSLSNLDPNNKDSKEGQVYYSIGIILDERMEEINKIIEVPIIERNLQKHYIAQAIIKDLHNFLDKL